MYTSPKEVEIVRNADAINTAYCTAYKDRYFTDPFVESEDLQVFTFLSKNFGVDRALSIVRHYLKMNDEWFLKQAHNARTLRKDVQKVIADLGMREGKAQNSVGLKIRTVLYCDRIDCHAPFEWQGDPNDIARPSFARICPKCAIPLA